MNIDEFTAEAESLRRKCFFLGEEATDSGVVAYWGGDRAGVTRDPTPEACGFQHIVTVSEKLFLELGLLVTEPVALVEFLSDTMVVPHEIQYQMRPHVPATIFRPGSSPKFADVSCTGRPLYATAATSFPPFEAVCLYGSERLKEWLRSLGLGPHDYWHQSLDVLRDEYYWKFQERSEFYHSDADVIVGGWAQQWSDECYPPEELRLLFFTKRDAEPWFEAWYSPANETCYVKSRIT